MGTVSSAEMNFGIVFKEDFLFPWDGYQEHGEALEEWWLAEVLEWKPPVEIFTPEGEYINDIEPDKTVIDAHYKSRELALEKTPVPVRLVNYCRAEDPMWMIAVGWSYRARRGYPLRFDRFMGSSIDRHGQSDVQIILDFCNNHLKKSGEDNYLAEQISWYLTACSH